MLSAREDGAAAYPISYAGTLPGIPLAQRRPARLTFQVATGIPRRGPRDAIVWPKDDCRGHRAPLRTINFSSLHGKQSGWGAKI
jgi:hypothetical protein